MRIFEDCPEIMTNAWPHAGDLDVAASYPNGTCVNNISKETTRRELISIEGIEEHVFRLQGLNINGGHTNASEFCQVMLKAPSFDVLLESFIKEKDTA